MHIDQLPHYGCMLAGDINWIQGILERAIISQAGQASAGSVVLRSDRSFKLISGWTASDFACFVTVDVGNTPERTMLHFK